MVVGFTGRAGSGKDTAALALMPYFRRYAFADPLKEMVNGLFGWDSRHSNELKDLTDERLGFSPRRAYQLFGTEFMRELDHNFWVKKAEAFFKNNKNVVVTDVRFENEAELIRKYGIIIHIFRSDTINVEEHQSESGIKFNPLDSAISNSLSIDDLHYSVREVACLD